MWKFISEGDIGDDVEILPDREATRTLEDPRDWAPRRAGTNPLLVLGDESPAWQPDEVPEI
jgi:hypothetical protein